MVLIAIVISFLLNLFILSLSILFILSTLFNSSTLLILFTLLKLFMFILDKLSITINY